MVLRMMWGQVDVSNGNLTAPSQVYDGLLEFHLFSGCTRRFIVLDALADVDHQTTASVVSCATVISVSIHSIEAEDFLVGSCWRRFVSSISTMSFL